MKVLVPGRVQKGEAVEAQCKGPGGRGCGAVLLVEAGEVTQSTRSCMGDSETVQTFQCCSCGCMTTLPKAKWVENPGTFNR